MNQSDPTTGVPITSLDNPFPGGLIAPIGSSLGLLTNTGGDVRFVDQNKGDPKVHQYSFDIQRELPGNMAVTVGYIGATGRDIGYFGTAGDGATKPSTSTRSIRRWPARRSRLPNGAWNAAALRANVPNPFFGIPGTGEFGSRADRPGRSAAAAVPAVRRRLQVRNDRGRTAPVPRRHVRPRQAHHRVVGWPLQLHLQQDRGQPVRAGQHVPDAHRPAAEQLRPRRRVRRQQLRFAAPDHPGADHEVPQLEQQQRRRQVAAQRLERLGGGRAGQRFAAERGLQRRHVRRQPGAARRPPAAQPHRRPQHRRAATPTA